jgi:hypothetical protein
VIACCCLLKHRLEGLLYGPHYLLSAHAPSSVR